MNLRGVSRQSLSLFSTFWQPYSVCSEHFSEASISAGLNPAGIEALILPAMTGVKPKLTPLAAFGLTLVMILAAVFRILRAECNFVPIDVVLGGGATFIAYGRLLVRPIAPTSIGTFRALRGLAVLGALVLVDFAPVRYKLTHTH